MDKSNFDELLKFCQKALLFLDKKHKEVRFVYGDVPKAKIHVLFTEITEALTQDEVDFERVAGLWVLITVENMCIRAKLTQSQAKFPIGDFSAN